MPVKSASVRGLLLMLAVYSNPRWLTIVRGAVERLTDSLGFPAVECGSITRAVDEALTNIVRYSYGNRLDQPIVLYFRRTERPRNGHVQKGLEILLCDRGPEVDPGQLHGRPLEEIRPGGLGLHFIRQAIDTVECTRKGPTNRLRLVKYMEQANSSLQGEDTVTILTRHADKATIFDLAGDIDFANSPVVRQSVLREIRKSPDSRVVVNLSQVRYIDSSGVASLVEGLKASRELGSRFILIGLTTSARQVLELSRLLKVFEVYEDEAQALAA